MVASSTPFSSLWQRYLKTGVVLSPFTSTRVVNGNVTPKFFSQKDLMSLLSSNSCPPKLSEGNPTITKLLLWSSYNFSKPLYCGVNPHFEAVFTAYERSTRAQHIEARLKLLGLLYHLHDFDLQRNIGPVNPQQTLLRRFIQLIDNHYIDKRTVQEYADMLSVSANYLSQCVKQVSGKNALTFITGRLANEARALIQYTDLEIAQIAYQLNFSDPANFGKFFKKQTGLSPSEFRRARR